MSEVLEIAREGQVERITLNRPDRLNALNDAMVDALLTYFEGLYRRPEVRVVVLQAAGRAFCAGLDMQPGQGPVSPHGEGPVASAWGVQTKISDIYRAMRRCPQPIIALIQGAACGGGFSLALASDVRIAADTARMNCAYIRIGLTGCDMGSSYFLPRLVGASRAAELILTGRFIDAQEAMDMTLVSRVVPEADLRQAADPLIDDMLSTAPMGLRLSKQALNMAIDAPSLDSALAMEDRHQALLAQSQDSREAVAAFLEKRSPRWTDG